MRIRRGGEETEVRSQPPTHPPCSRTVAAGSYVVPRRSELARRQSGVVGGLEETEVRRQKSGKDRGQRNGGRRRLSLRDRGILRENG